MDVSHHEAIRLTAELIEKADFILVMDRSHQQTIVEMNPGASEKIFLLGEFNPEAGPEPLDVPDLIWEPLAACEKVIGEMKHCLEELLKKIDWYLAALMER